MPNCYPGLPRGRKKTPCCETGHNYSTYDGSLRGGGEKVKSMKYGWTNREIELRINQTAQDRAN